MLFKLKSAAIEAAIDNILLISVVFKLNTPCINILYTYAHFQNDSSSSSNNRSIRYLPTSPKSSSSSTEAG